MSAAHALPCSTAAVLSVWAVILRPRPSRPTGASDRRYLHDPAGDVDLCPKWAPSFDDRDHTLKKITMIPLPDDWRRLAERFGPTVWTLFNMTEWSVPTFSEPNRRRPEPAANRGSAWIFASSMLADLEVPVGEVGELIVRTVVRPGR